MDIKVELECPQCGAPIDLDETDHLLKCPYCGVNNFLFTPSYFRFVLPHQAVGKEIIYAPYLRFKGAVFFCQGLTVGHKFVDITHAGLSIAGIPMTLGFRTQTMKMKFVSPDTEGSLLKFPLNATEIITKAGNLSSDSSLGKLFHRAFIGETVSLIYLPLYVEKNVLYDAILNRPIGDLDQGMEVFETHINKNPQWRLTFIPTLCPQCGWNLGGEKDSIVLTCSNCDSAWEADEGKFVPVDFQEVPGQDDNTFYLPFWKTSVTVSGVEINSFADFIRVTNQPRLVGEEWEKEVMSFWSPAFKLRPKIFLNLSRTLTLSQQRFQTEKAIPKKRVYPITLPREEAVQSMKLVLASSSINKKNVLPLLPGIKFKIKGSALVYLPFTDNGTEMVQQQIGVAVSKKTLEFARFL